MESAESRGGGIWQRLASLAGFEAVEEMQNLILELVLPVKVLSAPSDAGELKEVDGQDTINQIQLVFFGTDVTLGDVSQIDVGLLILQEE